MALVLNGPHGTITVSDSVLVQIASRAAESVDGLRVRRRGRSVDVEARAVKLEVAASRGEPLVTRGERVQKAVAAALKETCDLDVTVDVAFEELASEASR